MHIFSKHMLLRMRERNISPTEIMAVLDGEVAVVSIESPKDKTIMLLFGKVGIKYLLVVYNFETKTCVTVRPMRKSEKLFYEEATNE
jgi:hypothetical protein